ncbi:Holliday junction DNA helicase subunit RuvA [Candidatus Methanoperedens nitroreducens]|uniref:Holliday junction DNA helicase subunit RuvA n=1 Tax=Candidatus Methanoperedens nitratireducens TaxID=1392998 RepID=A0A062VEA8_9EURY|nr:Holliday junction branch migration protein RuvA [Candidatus Methanoperedens nitroreducens]KCZ73525.1 Holliday junction DNA helicase subunit RuvA [Candidatus Methanoperedens nitroreducens]MDJ1422517.1 Holliday junction branch migration protein RuvA [Candidatus Methanoperedens sp.]
MISHIYGEIAHISEGSVVIDVNGLGYQINTTQPTLQELRDRKEKVKLYTYLHVREDAMVLYGFRNGSELEMFKLLISVTRVGPQIALNILSQVKVEELAAAIINEDERVLTRIPGVGPKNAKRLILEIRDKMKKKMEGLVPASAGAGNINNINYDAVNALISLGFSQREAREAVDAVSSGLKEPTAQAVIKAALLKLKER